MIESTKHIVTYGLGRISAIRRRRRLCGWVNAVTCLLATFALAGCGRTGYSNDSMFPKDIGSVCLEMFDNQTFRRGVEYDLSDALAKRIETDTPYKIVSSRERADTVISGRIISIAEAVLSSERELGGVLEKEMEIATMVTWKNLKTGDLLVENEIVRASATYSEYQNQDAKYAYSIAANNLARKIVELMETKW
jgi:hypothetical protein